MTRRVLMAQARSVLLALFSCIFVSAESRSYPRARHEVFRVFAIVRTFSPPPCPFESTSAYLLPPLLFSRMRLAFQDGFLTLVIPMIRFAGGVPVLVHSRRSPPDESLAMSDGTLGTNDTSSGETGLWDLRVKVDLAGQASNPSGDAGSSSGAEQGGTATAGEGEMDKKGAPLPQEG